MRVLSTSAFSEHGPRVLYNYPQQLAGATAVSGAVFLGSTRREEPADPQADEWLADAAPFVYVSFGSFLSVRDDVLRRVCDALRAAGARAAIATGSTPPAALGPLPDDWLVRSHLPQVRMLGAAAAAVTHGGNNSVTEALGAGVPLLVLPFSTDQFAGAAAIEAARLGVALAPNEATVAELREALETLLDRSAIDEDLLARVVADQRAESGPDRAYRSLMSDAIASASPEASR